MEDAFYIGTDIGGTTFSSAIFDYDLNLIKTSEKSHISNFSKSSSLLDAVANQIESISAGKKVVHAGFACPGPLNAKEGKILETPNLTLLQNCQFQSEMEERLSLPCRIENDANLFALGEWSEYNKKKDVFIGITLGTGLGFGIVLNGKMFTGGNGMAAEYGISPYSEGTWEAGISITAIHELTIQHLGQKISPLELNVLATEGDKNALRVWTIFGKRLGTCLSHIINMLDPNAISIGGGIAHAFKYFEAEMTTTIEKHSPSFFQHNITIFESTAKELSAMKGAAMYF